MDIEEIFQIGAFAVAVIGAVTDLKTGRIPNKLTFTGILGGLLLRLFTGGAGVFAAGLSGLFAGGLTILIWILGGIRAGDVKLYMAVGAIAGIKFVIFVEIVSFIAGGAAAVIIIIKKHMWKDALNNLRGYFTGLLTANDIKFKHGGKYSYFSFGWTIALASLIGILI